MKVFSAGITRSRLLLLLGLLAPLSAGCASPYHQDRGALFGGLTGAGVGALIGEASGNPLAGAAIGAGVGAMTGSAVGQSLDEIEARNRAEIESRLGRPVTPGSVTNEDVVAMTRAGVDEQVLITHIRNNGLVRPLQSSDLIFLQNNGVSPAVVQAMQTAPPRLVATGSAPPPVIVEEYHHYDPGPPWWGPSYHYHHHHGRRWHRRSHVGWGISFSG